MVLLVMAPTDILKSVFVYDIRCVLMRQIIRLKDRDYLCRLLIRFDRVNVRNSDVLLHSVFFFVIPITQERLELINTKWNHFLLSIKRTMRND